MVVPSCNPLGFPLVKLRITFRIELGEDYKRESPRITRGNHHSCNPWGFPLVILGDQVQFYFQDCVQIIILAC